MFEATARLRIRDGELEGFKQQAAEILRLTKEKVDKPLRYDWLLSEDGTECEVREAYADPDALLEHQHYIADAKMKLFRDSVDSHSMTFYGEPSPALAAAMKAMAVKVRRLSLFQGLESDIETPVEVTASPVAPSRQG